MGFLAETDFKHQIYSEGEQIASKFYVSPDREATVEEILRSSRAFVNLIGKRAGNEGDVANLSFGVPRYEDRPFGDVAEKMARFVMCEEAEIVHLGENQLLVLMESDLEPDEFLKRFAEAPVQAYGQGYENLQLGLKIVEDMRKEDVLDPIRGKGETFKEIFYGRLKEKIRAFQRDKRISMVWNSWYEGEDMWSLNLDGNPQKHQELSSHRLAKGAIGDGIDRKEEYFKGEGQHHRYGFSVYWDPSVDCCRFSTNAQLSSSDNTSWEHSSDYSIYSSSTSRGSYSFVQITPIAEVKSICGRCQKDKDSSDQSKKCRCSNLGSQN